MIPVAKIKAPSGYAITKKKGDEWRQKHPLAKRPKDLWSPYLPHLADGFSNLCGYAAMLDPTGGTVDHYLSWNNHPHLAYEWSNFRFVSYILNSSKRTADDTVLDPYAVKSGWFEILLPSLQMQVTTEVPPSLRAKAEFTIKRLKLRDGEKIIRWRQSYYNAFTRGDLTLDGLRSFAPLLAEAVERQAKAASGSTGTKAKGMMKKKR